MSEQEKPVIFSDMRSDAERFDPALHEGALDPSRVPGYAEVVQANDINVADDLIFRDRNAGRTKEDVLKQIGAAPRRLPVELAWLPVPDTQSSAQRRQLDKYVSQRGFRLVKIDASDFDASGPLLPQHLRDHGYRFPDQARVAEDGSVRRGSDVALYWRDGEVARMWEAYRLKKQAEFEGSRAPKTFEPTAQFYDEEDKVESVIVKH